MFTQSAKHFLDSFSKIVPAVCVIHGSKVTVLRWRGKCKRPKKTPLHKLKKQDFLLVNFCPQDERIFVEHHLATVSIRTLCELANGGSLKTKYFEQMMMEKLHLDYHRVFIDMAGDFRYFSTVFWQNADRLIKNVWKAMDKYNLWYSLMLEIRFVPLMHQMYGTPFPIDRHGIVSELKCITDEMQELEQELVYRYGFTEKELSSTGEYGRELEILAKYQKLKRVSGQFSVDKLFRTSPDRDAISCEIHSIGTASFRCSTSNINLYGLPKRLRKYLQARVGTEALTFDIHASQIIILAWLSREEKLIRVYESGKDIYKLIASAMFSVKEDDVDERMRLAAKHCILIIINGGGIRSLSKELDGFGFSVAQVHQIKDSLFAEFSKMESYVEKLKTAEVMRLPSGRMWFAGDNMPESSHKRLSIILQGIEAEVLKSSLYLLSREIKGFERTELYMSLHDSIAIETVKGNSGKLQELVRNCILDSFRMYFPDAKNIIIKQEELP